MTMSQDHTESLGVARGPGQRLKSARQSLGHDVAWAAKQLNLKQSFVEALENNDFSRLPPPVFVQGYLKNYANLLGEPEGEILDEYRLANNISSPATPKAPVATPKPASKLADKIPVRPSGSASVKEKASGLLAGLSNKKRAPQASGRDKESLSHWEKAFAKKTTSQPEEVSPPPTRVEPYAASKASEAPKMPRMPEVPEEPQAPVSRTIRPLSQSATEKEKKAEDLPEPMLIKPDEGGLRRLKAIKPSMPGTSRSPSSGMSRGLGKLVVWLVVAVVLLGGLYWGASKMGNVRIKSPEDVYQDIQGLWNRLTGSDSKPEAQKARKQQLPGFSPPSRRLPGDPPLTESLDAPVPLSSDATLAANNIELEVLGNCWVEIEDASGQYRLIGELKKGERHRLGGSPPYQVLFGKGNLVRISVNGQPYDFTDQQQGAVAKFTLDP
jgi:cytoskeletal protein RodZ